MRICHVTPHLPPDQAANALLPLHLGNWARESGDEPLYVAHPPRAAGRSDLPGTVTWIPMHRDHSRLLRLTKVAAVLGAAEIIRRAGPAIGSADLVHVHSNGLLSELGAMLATWHRKPVVLTLYGTEIWHYRRRPFVPDLFARAYRLAAHVTFYSHGLSDRARELGLQGRDTSVVYPPVAPDFTWRDLDGQAKARASLGLRYQHLLLNVKRLHPLAGQRYLIEAMQKVIRRYPDTGLVICGTGPLLDDLKGVARDAGVESHVTFAGLLENRAIAHYCAAADAFVLPSLLEACPTVALEALACGTPVISSDNPGGVELNKLFGRDVCVVPREQPEALARTIVGLLENKRRTCQSTVDIIERDLRPAPVAARFRAVYREAVETGR